MADLKRWAKMDDRFPELLKKLGDALRDVGESRFAGIVAGVANGSEDEAIAFLRSNELWGGAGSIADEAGVADRAKKKKIEAALIALGNAQIAEGITNPRTATWVDVFSHWRRNGI